MKVSILQPQIIHELGSRSNQEDSVYPRKNNTSEGCRVFILCDGMGGHENGEVASMLVCQELSDYIVKNWDGGVLSDELFNTALDVVFLKINEYDSDSFRKMGTTLTFLCLHKGGVMMAHIGDSRIYHIRPSENRIIYKSRDHSLAYDLYLAEEISYKEMTTYKKNIITRAIMPGLEHRHKADIAHTTDILTQDYFLLCSDGMFEKMNDNELVDILSTDKTNEEKRALLIEKSKDNKDNHSAILIQISKVEKEESDYYYTNDELTTISNMATLEKESIKVITKNGPTSQTVLKKGIIVKLIICFLFLLFIIYLLIMLCNMFNPM